MSLAHNGLPLSSRCLRRASSSSPVAPAVSSIPTSAHSCTSFSISGSARGALNFAHGFGSSDFGVSNFGPTVLGFAGAYTFGYAMFRIRNSDSHLILIDPHLKKNICSYFSSSMGKGRIEVPCQHVVRIMAILQTQHDFGRELVDLHTTLSILGKFTVHARIWCGGLSEVQRFISVHRGSNSFWHGKRC